MSHETLDTKVIDCIPGMVLLKREQYYLAEPCFDLNYPNIAFIKSVIDHKIPGYIFVDSLESPRCAAILTTGPFGFVSKNYPVDSVKNIYGLIKNRIGDDFKLVLSPSVTSHFSFQSIPTIERLQFGLNKENLIKKDMAYPEDMILSRIDKTLFERCSWKGLMTNIYGKKENYLMNGAGYCLLYHNEVISEAHAVISKDFAELGVFTHPNFRNRGLSAIVCHYLLLYCLDRGVLPWWSCNVNNIASRKLAIKLGFDNPCLYKALIF